MQITYQPTAHDPDHTVVAGVSFDAYVPTHVEDLDLASRLKSNPWFTDDVIDEARHAAWQTVRAAQEKAREQSAETDRLEAQP